MNLPVQLGLMAGILAYGVILACYVPKKLHFFANVVAACVAVVLGFAMGLSLAEMGMGLHVLGKGIVVAAVFSVLTMIGVFVVASIPPLRRYFVAAQHMGPNKLAYETTVRIPLSTALTEEILFRGVLLGVLLSQYGTVSSVVICSLVFGVWHILPSLERLSLHAGATQHGAAKKSAYVLATIAATAVAGVFFSWLRILSGSIIAPWLAHWSINASGTLASAFATKLHGRAATDPSSKKETA